MPRRTPSAIHTDKGCVAGHGEDGTTPVDCRKGEDTGLPTVVEDMENRDTPRFRAHLAQRSKLGVGTQERVGFLAGFQNVAHAADQR